MNRRLRVLASAALISTACGLTEQDRSAGLAHARGSSALTAPLALPASPGNGLVMKAVCLNQNQSTGACTVGNPVDNINNVVKNLNAPAPSTTPPGSPQVLDFVPAGPVEWTDFGGLAAKGLFQTNQDLTHLFGPVDPTSAVYSFSGYLAIPPSATPTVKSFAVGSDDGFLLAINYGGAALATYTQDTSRSFAYGGTASSGGSTTLVVTFPANVNGALYPLDLVYYQATGPQGLELAWASGSTATLPTAGNLNGFSLVPQSSLYSPDIHATLTATNLDAAAGAIGPTTNLRYTTTITNRGLVAASNLTLTIPIPGTQYGASSTSSAGCSLTRPANPTQFACTGINVAPGASVSLSFTAPLNNLAANSVVALQGVVTGLATSTDFATTPGDTAEVFVYTTDASASPPLSDNDTGNAPASIAGSPALSDDDATSFTVGSVLAQAPVLTAPTGTLYASATQTVSGTSSQPANSLIKVVITGPTSSGCLAAVQAGTFSCSGLALADGSYSATAAIANSDGDSGPTSAPFAFTVLPPLAPTLIAPQPAAVLRQSAVLFAGSSTMQVGATVRVTSTDPAAVKRTCTGTIQADGSFACAQTLADGGYSWIAAVLETTGAAGTASAPRTFTVNTAGLPAPTINPTSTPTKLNLPTFSGTASALDTGAGYALVVYDGSSAVCTVNPAVSPWSCAPAIVLGDGLHLVNAVITDASGNVSAASNADVFSVDTTPPNAPTLDPLAAASNQTQPTLSGSGEPGALVTVTGVVSGNTTTLCTATVPGSGVWSCAPAAPLAQGSYTATARQVDAATNASPISNQLAFTIDTTPPARPTISAIPSPTNNSAPMLSGTAETGSALVVKDQTGRVLCTVAPVTAGSWSCNGFVLPDGASTLTATSTDDAGNSTSSLGASVVVDTVAPLAPVLAQTASPTSITTPTFSGTAEPGSTVTVKSGSTVLCMATAASGTGLFSCASLSALAGAPQSYAVIATAADAAHNSSGPSNTDNFIVDTRPPPAPTLDPLPVPAGGQPDYTTSTQPLFTGTGAAGDLVSVVAQPGGAVLCSAIVSAGGTWSCTTLAAQAISGSPATAVTVSAQQMTPAGVTGPGSATYSFTVDTAAPAAPAIAGLPANSSNPSQIISGTADAGTSIAVRDESGRVLCNVGQVPSDGSWSCTPTLPLHEGSNTLVATSTGPSGLGADSAPASINVDSLPPLPPVLAQTASPSANTLPTFLGSAEPGTTIRIYDGGGATPVALCTTGASSAFSCTATTPLPGAPSTHSVQATATDAAGNTSQLSNIDSFVVDTRTPSAPTLNALPTPANAQAGFIAQPQPTFSGTGTPGDLVTVTSTAPSSATLCTATVLSDGSWSCTASTPLAGSPATQYTLQATQTDPAGTSSGPSAAQTVTVSTDVPNAPTLSAPSGTSTTASVALSGTADANAAIVVKDQTGRTICTATADANGNWSCTTQPLPDGTSTLTASSYSASGVVSAPSAPAPVTVSTFAPPPPTLDQTASPNGNGLPIFSGGAQPGSAVVISDSDGTVLCSATADASGLFGCPSSQLTDGPHAVTAVASNGIGNSSAPSTVDSFVVDTSVPAAPTLDPLPASSGGQANHTANPYPTFTGTGTPGDTVSVASSAGVLCLATVHGDGTWSCTDASALAGNPPQSYTVTATQTSPAGNSGSSASQVITVDTTGTATPTLDQPASPTRNAQPTFTGTGAPGDTIEVFSGSAVLCSAIVATGGTWGCAPAVPLIDGSYVLTAVAIGAQGTVSPATAPRTLIINSATLPAPSFDVPASPTENTQPLFSGTGQPGAMVTVSTVTVSTVGVDEAPLCTAAVNNAGAWNCAPADPLPLGAYTLRARQTDEAGNSSPPSAPRVVDIIAPQQELRVTIDTPADGSELTDARPTIAGSSTPGTVVQVALDHVNYAAQSSADGQWSFTPQHDLAPGAHFVSAMASDALGGVANSLPITFTVAASFRGRGGCASGGVPVPALALVGLLVLLRTRRRSTPIARRAVGRSLGRMAGPLALSLLLAGARPASAQTTFNLETFRPAAGGDGYVGVEGARPPQDGDAAGEVDVKLWFDGSSQPLTGLQADGSTRSLVRNRDEGWLSGQFHLFGPLSLSLQVPLLLAQHGDLSFLPAAARGPSSFSASVGDVRLTPRLGLLRQEHEGIDLAIQASLELPTGQQDSLSSDGRTVGEGLIAMAHRFYSKDLGSLELIGNVYARLRPPHQVLDVKVGGTAGGRLGLGYYLESDSPFLPQRIFAEVDGQSYLRAGFVPGSSPSEWRAGLTYCLFGSISIDGAAGSALGNGIGAPSFRGVLAIGYSPASCRAADRDGDGVPDATDKCPDAAGPATNQGCPLPPDRDGDGVPDAQDDCPDDVGLKENHGCPANHDRDGDGVPDMQDRCPNVPGPASNSGCPELRSAVCEPAAPGATQPPAQPQPSQPPLAAQEQPPPRVVVQPSAPEAAPPAPKPAELPLPDQPLVPLVPLVATDAPDRDHDGVPDAEDNCPDTAGPAENHGCPKAVQQLVVIHGDKLDILDKVYFRSTKAVIESRSFKLLDQVAAVLRSHPDLTRIEVQGHTDNVGRTAKNELLSQQRAEAVVSYLIRAGVEPGRLTARGFGERQPIAPNVNKAGREANRRVEFHVTEVKSHPVGELP